MLLLPWMNYPLAVVMLVVLGGYYAATDGVLMALASRMLPADLRTTGLALLTTGTGLARLLASALYGTVWSWYGAERALAVFIAGLVTVLWVARRTVREVDTH
jgi:predicted MFS family arabinose efflux permease